MTVARKSVWRRWVICLLSGLTLFAVVNAEPAEASERLLSFGPDGTEASNFSRIGSIGVDQEIGAVYVLDELAGELFKFDVGGQPVGFGGSSSYISGNRISELEPFSNVGFPGAAQMAVNSETGSFYVTEKTAVRAFQANGEPLEFTAGPGAGTSEIPGFAKLYGVAIDSSGNIYASDNAGTVSIFAPSGAPITSFSASTPYNLTVASNGAIYVIEGAERVVKFTPSVFPVTGSTTYTETMPIPRNGFAFLAGISTDPISQDVYLIETSFVKSWVRRYDQTGGLVEQIGEPGTPSESEALGGNSQGIAVLEEEQELAGGKFAKFYVADSAAKNESQAAIFGKNFIIGPPSMKGLRVTDVTADSAVLRAFINPNTKDTKYQFEYGLEDCSLSVCTPVPVGGAVIEEGTEYVPVVQTIMGLTPGTAYHYRLLAENEFNEPGVPTVESGTFTTQSIGAGFELSDGRVWEMVSPPNKRGATLVGPGNGSIQASVDGSGISYLSRGSIEPDPEGSRNLEAASVLASRNGDGIWASRDITPENVRVIPMNLGQQSEYKLFNPDLSTSMLEPRDGTSLSPAASERTPYIRTTDPVEYAPLVTGKEGFANVPPGTEFGGSPDSSVGRVRISGANPSLSDIVLSSSVSLLEGQPKAPPGIYHWKAGKLQPVGVLPSTEGGDFVQSLLGSGSGSVRHAISDNGTRVFWGAGTYSTGGNDFTGLYLRDTENEETVRLDVVQSGAGAGSARPAFQGASSDGSVAMFTDSHHLTEDASPKGRDLYRCELSTEDPALGCVDLTNISGPAIEGPGESAEVLGLVSGISDDGSTLYFVAKGNLDSAPNENGENAVPGEPNLYGWQEGGDVRFIAALSEEDDAAWGSSSPGRTLEMTAIISPSGRYFGFMSQRDLAGEGNEDAETGNPVEEAFLYDAAADSLDCISCDPTGAAPTGEELSGDPQLVDSLGQWGGRWVAAILPQPTIIEGGGISLYQPRAVFDSGRVFFNTFDSLVPGDSNGQWDTYQFEPVGVGSCEASTGGQASTRSGNGCVSLISSGTGGKESAFIDASASGDDIFFFTSAQLSVRDKDSEVDVYDARVGGVAAVLSPEAECAGQECRPSASPPNISSPGSETFIGPGNLKQTKKCPKGKRKVKREGKTRCIPRKKKQQSSKGGGKRRQSR